jgi:tricorn protease
MSSFRSAFRTRFACVRWVLSLSLATVGTAVTVATAFAIDVTDTRLLTQPAVSAKSVAFIYAGDLWTCARDGTNVRRVTSDAGQVSNPVFSPDGSLIAFSAQYDGNVDVFVVSASGGMPTRLTWHPGADIVQAFTPDGKAVLFTSPRAVFTNRYTQLFTVPVTGGVETPLPIPNASRATYASDGQRLAYSPLAPAFLEWKHYRGGTNSRIFLYRPTDHGIDKIPQPATRANDVDPMWVGDTVYFRSDRDGEFNLYAFDTKTSAIAPLTHHSDFPVLNASATSDAIVYEQAGYLHLIDLKTKQDARLKIGVAADLVETRTRFVKGAQYVRHAALSPTGARAVFEFRGEIVTVPAEKGDPRNLTNSVAVHDRSPAWSADGQHIAYFSDESGEYALRIASQDGKGEARTIKLTGAGFYDLPVWSPDSQKIAFQDNARALFVVDVKSGASKKVTAEPIYSPVRTMSTSWSPDSKWLAYTVNTPASIQTVHVYSIAQDKSFAVTDGLSEVSQPIFDRSGKYLFFLGSTDAGPIKDWFAQSNSDARATEGIYVAVLRNDLPSPIAKESDEEKAPSASDEEKKKTDGKDTDAKEGTGKDAKGKDAKAKDAPDKDSKDSKASDGKDAKDEKAGAGKPPVVRIDVEGLAGRILDLPIPVGDYSQLQPGTDGQFYYLRTVDTKSSLQRFDLKTRKTEQILPDVSDFEVSADGKKMLYRTKDTWSIASLTKKVEPGEGKIAVDAVEVRVDPHAEWPEIFNEAWRINRDYFYAPNMHGVNWTAAREKYAAFLPDITNRGDLSRVIQWMCSELSVGHHRGGGGDTRLTPTSVPGGLLGADYAVENGRYRFKKIYGGLNWNPDLRAPLTEPGVNAKAGDYLLAVNGRDLRAPTNLYSAFENTSGKITEITLGANADGSQARTVQVVPIANEGALRNRDWVENNLRKVDAATGGRVAYVYVPNTAALGYSYFKRYFYPQATRDGIIVDERFNGGGLVADYYIDILRRPVVSYWATRYGQDQKTPAAGIHGPKVMITDETAGSGGDLLPFMFRQAKLGPIVGERTWGGLVGVLGFPVLMDGGTITAPNLAIWTQDGWVVENEGVPPDIEVEQTPADVINGRDPQLEKAISVVMDALKKDPPAHPTRPAYPVKFPVPATSTGQP